MVQRDPVNEKGPHPPMPRPPLQAAPAPPPLVFFREGPQSPAGKVLMALTPEGALCRLAFLGARTAGAVLAEWRASWPKTRFEKATPSKDKGNKALPHTFLLVGTAFQRAVWSALLDIPPGQTISYGTLACRIGRPHAARAVGQALAQNPIPWLVPCHRVIRTDGTLGGFSGGTEDKKTNIKKALIKEDHKSLF